MNLIKRLLGHREQPESDSSPVVNWPGQSGKEYPYEIFPIDASFRPLPANYIYAKQSEDGNWVPLFIAQTRDIKQRLEGHEKLQEAMEQGATHIHVHLSTTGQAARCTEEQDLIHLWQPVCNGAIEA